MRSRKKRRQKEREKRKRVQEQSGSPPSLFLIGVLEKGNGSEEHVLLLESSRARNTGQTPSVRPQALRLYVLYRFLVYNRNIPCIQNTADIGTKPLSGKRIKLLLHWLGFQDENNEPVGREELQEHRSQEQARASVRDD